VMSHTQEEALVRFIVTDTGPGVEASVLPTLFSPFVQADVSTSRLHGGTGLGLTLVRELAELMGGKAYGESVLGEGSSFWFELPLKLQPLTATVDAQAPMQNLRVLVADDELTSRLLLSNFATNFGWSCEAVSTGQALIDCVLAKASAGNLVDCILLDWFMPELDGLAVLKELHQRLEPDQMPAIVIITSQERSLLEQELHSIALKPFSILTKPAQSLVLFNMVNEAVAANLHSYGHVFQGTQLSSLDAYRLSNTNVLVVDDNRMNLDVCRRLLSHEGASTVLCRSGEEALAQFQIERDYFDIVLMDIQMPGMDGYETTRQIRALASGGAVPIVALTADALASEREKARLAGMTDFLAKPIDPDALIRVMRSHIETYRNRTLPLRPREAGENLSHERLWPRIAGLELAPVRRRLAGDLDLFLSLFDNFLIETSELLEQVRHGSLDTPSLLHRLKGQSGNMGAMKIMPLAHKLEQDALANALAPADLDLLEEMRADLSREMVRWRASMTQPKPAEKDQSAIEPELSAVALAELKTQLAESNLAALNTFATLKPALLSKMGLETFGILEKAISQLDFRAALQLLK
jgi:CheY-like chemotaxis protein